MAKDAGNKITGNRPVPSVPRDTPPSGTGNKSPVNRGTKGKHTRMPTSRPKGA